jgi:hypothetical protein
MQEPEFLPADLIQLVLKHIYFLRFFEGVRFRPLVHLIWNDPPGKLFVCTANQEKLTRKCFDLKMQYIVLKFHSSSGLYSRYT